MPGASTGRSARPLAARPAAGDLALAGTLATLGAALAYSAAAAQGFDAPAVPALLAAAEAAPLAWRRRAPLVVLGAAVGIFVVGTAVTVVAATPMLGPLVGVYTVGATSRRGVAAIAAGAVGLGTPLLTVAAVGAPFPLTLSVTATPGHLLDAMLGSMLGVGGATLLGAYVGTRRAYVSELRARAVRLEREREERAAQAVEEERARLARELHDVAAHHLSGIALQASALDRTLDRDPDEARGLIEDIRVESSTALTAMRRLVSLLRADDSDGRAPQPTIDDVEHLVERARADGAEIDLHVDVVGSDLPREVGLAAYRLVQESLTNARRHAPGAQVRVVLRRLDGKLDIEITDDGVAMGAAVTGTAVTADEGHGLIGMRERVALLGGRFEAGPRSDAPGWRVRAVLPTGTGGRR